MADDPIGVYSPQTAKMILDTVKYLQSRGLVSRDNLRTAENPGSPYRIFFRNNSGSTIPAYALMQITGVEEASGKTYHIVDQYSDGAFGGLLFNGKRSVPDDETGIAQTGIHYIAKGDGAGVTFGNLWGPASGSWTITKNGGPFMLLGTTDVGASATNTVRVQLDHAQTYRAIVTTEISARSGITDGSGVVTLKTIGPGAITNTLQTGVSVTSLLSDTIAVDAEVVVARTTNGRLQVIAEDCGDG